VERGVMMRRWGLSDPLVDIHWRWDGALGGIGYTIAYECFARMHLLWTAARTEQHITWPTKAEDITNN
jgi:hypothetical protein